MAQECFLALDMKDIKDQWAYYFLKAAIGPNQRILDIGCNRGDAIRYLLRLYPDLKAVEGIDPDEVAILEARQALEQEFGNSARFSVQTGDGTKLPYADNSFDRVFCVDVLEWVAKPQCLLAEAHRVLKPGGHALVIHSDFDTQVYWPGDINAVRAWVHRFTDIGPDGCLGRRLLGLCRSASFSSVEPFVYCLVNDAFTENSYSFQMAMMMKDWLIRRESTWKEPIERWHQELTEASAVGSFFYSINRNLCLCTK